MSLLRSEHQEQVAFVQWMRWQYPDDWIFAVPNGARTSIGHAAKLKAEGLTAGVPDLCVPSLKLFIEMKRQKAGTVSNEQLRWGDHLRSHGYYWEVARGCDEAMVIVRDQVARLNKLRPMQGQTG